MKKIYYLMMLLFVVDSSTAQTNSEEAPMYVHPAFSNGFVNAASPNVWSMIKYGDADVDLFTGTLGLSIPIYTYEDSDFTIPVSIGYSSSGYFGLRLVSELRRVHYQRDQRDCRQYSSGDVQ